jgi:glycosyltransferase involved in cell wall biosynthesis
MMAGPVVSVILSFLNEEQFLQEAICSVFCQTFERWELLLVDDGSTDGSSQIARKCAESHPDRVRYFEHPGHINLGLAASRNVALKNARGGYTAILDADDVWFSNKLNEQINIMSEHPDIGMALGASQYWRSWANGHDGEGVDTVIQAGKPMEKVQEAPALLRDALAGASTPPPSNILFRTAAAVAVGGFEECFRGVYMTHEDQAFLAKMYLSVPIFVSNRCWDKYRLRPNSMCALQEKDGTEPVARRFYLQWLDQLLASSILPDRTMRMSVRRALRTVEHPFIYGAKEHGAAVFKAMLRKFGMNSRSVGADTRRAG